MTRPPPLSLVSRPVHHQVILDEPKSCFTKVILGMNWKRAVIGVTILGAVRFGFEANTAFNDMNIDASYDMTEFASISLASGVMYAIASSIEIAGLFSALQNRLPLIRTFALVSFLASLLAIAASAMDLIVFFKFADELIDECAALSMDGLLPTKSTFSSDLWPPDQIKNCDIAEDLCFSAWDAASSLRPVSFVLLDLVPAILVFIVPYVYYRQLINSSRSQAAVPAAQYSSLDQSPTAAAERAVVRRDMASLYSAPVTVTLYSYHQVKSAGTGSPGPPSFGARNHSVYATYDTFSSSSAGQEHGKFV